MVRLPVKAVSGPNQSEKLACTVQVPAEKLVEVGAPEEVEV